MRVATEEMTHMALACNLLTAVGGKPHTRRPNLPSSPRAYPPTFRLGLIPFTKKSLESFITADQLFEEGLAVMKDVGDRHGIGAILLGMGMALELRGETEEAERLLNEAQTNLREGGGGAGMSWPISNVLVDTRTDELLAEATNRYQSSHNLPPAEWASMVYADRDTCFARYASNR